MKKKIHLLVLTSMWPEHPEDIGGIFVVDYVKAVQEHCQVSVLVMRMSGEQKGLKIEELAGMRIYSYCVSRRKPKGVIKYLLYFKWFYMGWELGRKIPRIDLIHAHGGTLSGNLGLFIARSLKIPIIITEHTNPFRKLLVNPISRILTRRALQKVDVVLTVSQDLKKQIEESGIKPKKIYVTYNPVDTDLFQPQEKSGFGNDKNILFAGRLEEYKGGMRVVHAFQRLLNECPGWRLVLVGDGSEMGLIKHFVAETTELANRVSLTGQLTKEKLASEMKHTAFFAYPSRYESFGIVVAEAMAAGLTVIVGKGTAMDEFVDDSCGMLVDPDDVNAIAEAMRRMIQNLDSYDAKKIRRQVVERFGFEAFGKRLFEIYQSVM